MERIESRLDIAGDTLDACFFALPEPREGLCFFDIETTGLSPKVSSLYLIGAACYREDRLYLIQWFADDYVSEREILLSFAEFVKPFSTLAHYNGATFDIPYLEEKYACFGITSPFTEKNSLDIFQSVRKNKKAFGTPDQKLTTMEKRLGFRRRDAFSGRDCIRLYTEFMQKKYFRDDAAAERKENLLLHNQDDLTGTILCCQFLLYRHYTPASPVCRIQGKTMYLQDTAAIRYPVPCQMEKDSARIFFAENILRAEIPLFKGTLYHFYENYKDYYYLPEEDMAVHKSVGIYVDKEHREKARASNCYTKKSGFFLPLPKKFAPDGVPLFRETRKNPLSYLYIADAPDTPGTSEPSQNNIIMSGEAALSKEQRTAYLQHLISQ